ncbi:MAG: heavy-metal-associated domain-containing protein [Deltaproteobacteria bacterium]|jgi:mercuric transport protein|nr:heavy-metal-associated domain-containing protein [Deltaproteobacteria bacterium]
MKRWIVGAASGTLLAVAGLGAASVAASDPVQAQAESRVTLHVEGMHCATCPIAVRVAVSRLPGVREVTVSLEQARAVVAYDPAQVTPARIVQAIEEAGYHARVEN